MLTRLHVENFKCLLNVDIDLAPFTVLIGPNDSGKSSILDAILLLGQTAKGPTGQVFVEAKSLDNLVWQRDPHRNIVWNVEVGNLGHSIQYLLEISPILGGVAKEKLKAGSATLFEYSRKGTEEIIQVSLPHPGGNIQQPIIFAQTALSLFKQYQQRGTDPVLDFLACISSARKYCLEPAALRVGATPKVALPGHANGSLSPCGDNLAAVLDSILTSPDRSMILGLEKVLQQEIPTICSVSTYQIPQHGTAKGLQYGLANTKPVVTIPAELVSDGAILLTAFLALGYSDTPNMIFIEEPENGFHYSRLKLVIDYIRKMTTGEIGDRPRQVIIATHSPLLLNFCQPEEVRICLRDKEKGTTVTPMSKVHNIKQLLKEFGTGELWYLLGEEKLVKEKQE
jgi:predicted ATPase